MSAVFEESKSVLIIIKGQGEVVTCRLYEGKELNQSLLFHVATLGKCITQLVCNEVIFSTGFSMFI